MCGGPVFDGISTFQWVNVEVFTCPPSPDTCQRELWAGWVLSLLGTVPGTRKGAPPQRKIRFFCVWKWHELVHAFLLALSVQSCITSVLMAYKKFTHRQGAFTLAPPQRLPLKTDVMLRQLVCQLVEHWLIDCSWLVCGKSSCCTTAWLYMGLWELLGGYGGLRADRHRTYVVRWPVKIKYA